MSTPKKPEQIQFDASKQELHLLGCWDLSNVEALNLELKSLNSIKVQTIDGREITKMDSAGAWLIIQLQHSFKDKAQNINFVNFSSQQTKLLKLIDKKISEQKPLIPPRKKDGLEKLGENTVRMLDEFADFLGFIGYLTFEFFRLLSHPNKIRWNDLTGSIDKTGLSALPIIGLLSFMIGIVLAYQLGVQLRNYGANVFIVNLMGLSILREFGPLLTAIMVAGRTGSSFTAQLGIMKINQEIDALDTMGITSAELLIIPRIIGLVIVLPLLTIWSDIFGILGGMVMSNNMLHISYSEFLHRFQQEIPLKTLLIGLGKAPVFALIIASVGCFEGMRVSGSADSIGKNTTRSVVLGIFFIIIVDAAFSVILSRWKI